MAATYSTAGSGGSSVSATTQDTDSTLVVPSGAVVYAIVQNSDGSPVAPSGVSLDPTGTPQAFTQIGTTIDNETYYKSTLWRLTNATGVTAVVRATFGSAQGEKVICVWVGTGIDTTTPNGTVEQASAASTSAAMTDTIATTAGQLVLAFGAYQSQNVTQRTFDSPNGTERAEMTSDPDDYEGAAIQEIVAAGSSVTPVWTIGGAGDQGWTMFTIALNDASAGGSAPPRSRLTCLGVG